MKLRDHSLSVIKLDVDKYRLLEPFAFFPPGNRIYVPVTASSSMKNIGPVLSMNGEVGQGYFPLSAPQAKLSNKHGAHFLFLQELLHTTGHAGQST